MLVKLLYHIQIHDNAPLVGSNTNNRVHINGSIQLTSNNDAIVFGRGTSSFMKDEEIGFGWGGGWYMTDATYLRVRNNKILYSTGEFWASRFNDVNDTGYYGDFASESRLNQLKVKNLYDWAERRFTNPDGGASTGNPGTTTGALRIRLPQNRRNSSTMLRMTVKVYEYSTGRSTTFEIGGYNYGPGNWYNIFATQLTDAGRSAFTIRWGDDGSREFITIGETGTTWSYPQVYITEVQTGHSGYSTNWGSGWSIDFATSISGVEQSRTASLVLTTNNSSANGDIYGNNAYFSRYYDRDNTGYYGDFASTSNLNQLNVITLNVSGNTTLGNGNGDTTHINDIVHIGATDSGNSDLFFGEGSTNNITYGAHWNWDSGYRFTWNTRNNGTDTTLFYYDTNSTSYVYWNRHFHMQNKEINYLSQVHFNDNVRFYDEGNDSYLNFKYGDTNAGGIKIYNGSNVRKGYLYADNSGFGLLDNDGNWAVRTQTGSNPLELRTNNNVEFYVYDSYTYSPGSSRAPIFYDSNDTGYYADPASTTRLNRLYINPRNDNYNVGSINSTNNQSDWQNLTNTNGQFTVTQYNAIQNYSNSPSGVYTYGSVLSTRTANHSFQLYSAHTGDLAYKTQWNNDNYSGWLTIPAYGRNGGNSGNALYASQFIDSNSTGYYADPASTSNFYNLQLTGAKHTYLYISPGNGYEAMVRFNGGSGSTWYVGSRTTTQLLGSQDAFHVYSQTRGRTVSGTDNSGNTYSYGSSRAPIFYDLDNTGYYVNPNTTGISFQTLGQIRTTRADGFRVDSASYARIDLDSNNNWSYIRLQDNGAVSWDIASYNGGNLELRPGGGGSNRTYFDSSGNSFSEGSKRAPIFYDSNNTGYYLDPNTSGISLNAYGTVRGNYFVGSRYASTGYTVYKGYDNWNHYISIRGYARPGQGKSDAAILGGHQTSFVEYAEANDTTGWFFMGSQSSNYVQVAKITKSYSQFVGSVRSPLFYDSNDTGYYGDFASTSRVNILKFGGSTNNGRFDADEWGVRFKTDSGYILFGPANTGHAHIYTDRSNFYFNKQLQVNGGTLINTNDIRSKIYYDRDNTNYYTDPASTSVLNELQVNGLTVDGYKLADTASRSVSAGQWVTIATGSGRQYATFNVWDTNGGRHGSMSFTAGISYGGTGTITLLGKSWYSSGGIFNNIRIRKSGTYDTHYLQIYCDTAGTLYYAITNNFQSSGWSLTTSGTGSPASSTAAEVVPDTYPGLGTNQAIAASRYYDVNSTSYYGDFASTSYMNDVRANIFYERENTAYYFGSSQGDARMRNVRFNSVDIEDGATIESVNNNGRIYLGGNLHIDSYNGNDIYLNYYSGRRTRTFYSSNREAWRSDTNGIVYAFHQHRSPIYYDYNNTGYYSDPSGASNFNTSIRATEIYARNWFRNDNSGEGLYNQATGMHWYSDSNRRWRLYGGQSTVEIGMYTSGNTLRGYYYADNSNNIGILDAGGSWAIRHQNDNGTYFYTDNSALEFRVGRDTVTGNYGTVQTSTTRGGWGGYSINGGWVFMHDHSNAAGIYNDYENEWAIYMLRNSYVELRYNGTWEQRTQSGYVQARGSYRAPIFYDSNDTGYYLDPNSTGTYSGRVRQGILFGPNTSWGRYLAVGTNGRYSNEASVATTNGNLHLDARSLEIVHILTGM